MARNSKLLIDLDDIEAAQLIARICAICGIALPSVEVMQLVWESVLTHHKTHTVKSFSLAFELNAAGRLGDKRIEHFNSFDLMFIGSVMKSFEERRRLSVKEASKTVHEDHVLQLLPTDCSDEMMSKMYRDHLEQVKRGNYLVADLLGCQMMDWLMKSGQVTDDDIPNELYLEWQKKSRAIVFEKNHIGMAKWNRLKETKSTEYEKIKIQIVAETKRMCYIWHLNNQIKRQ